jgi:hypothetical protein
VGCAAEVLSLVRPRFGSLGVDDEPIPLGDLLSHRFPSTKVMRRPVDEDDRFAGALLDVLQANPIDLNLLGGPQGTIGSPPLGILLLVSLEL